VKTAVTGALGHIGSRLIREWPRAFPGGEIVMLDNLSTQRYCSLFDLPPAGNYRFTEADILDCDIAPLIGGAGVVIHLAAITNAEESFANPERVEEVNCRGTERVARACVKAGIPMIFLSTTSVYGSRATLVDEDCPEADLKPQSPYAETKLKAERVLHELGQQQGLRFVVCRFGTICGVSPGMRFHTAINKFCWQAVMGRPLTVWKTALNQKRPYLSLSDAVAALALIVRTELYDRRIYNVLTDNLTPHDIVGMIREQVPAVQVNLTDAKIMNLLSYEVSNKRFAGLGFESHGSVRNDIAETIRLLKDAGRPGLGSVGTTKTV